MAEINARLPQLAPRDVELGIKLILDAIATRLAAGGRLEVRGFGVMRVRNRRVKFEPAVAMRNNLAPDLENWYLKRHREQAGINGQAERT